MRKLSKLLFLAIPALLLVSCNNDDDPVSKLEISYDAKSNMVISEDVVTGETKLNNGCVIAIGLASDNSGSLALEQVVYDGENTMNLYAPELKWVVDNATGAFSLKAASLQAIPTSGNVRSLTVTDLEVSYLSRSVNGPYGIVDYPAVIEIEMLVEGRYKIEVVFTQVVSFGTTTVTTKANGSVYKSIDTFYSIVFDKTKMTANVTVYNAKFADKMPAQTKIVIPGVPFTVGKDGKYNLQAVEIIPNQANGSPKPEFKINNFFCNGEFGDDSELRFTVAGAWDVVADLDEESLPDGFTPSY